LEGEQVNPYRYIKNADYFLLPSFHEAAPIVFDEAAILGVPVLATKTLSAVEMIENRRAGFVCENSTEAIYDMLRSVLSSNEKLDVAYKPDIEICMRQFKKLYRQI
jgi:glycosyltransferase involved in cell wall biosynthesis